MKRVHERTQVRRLAHSVADRNRLAEHCPRLRRLDLEVGMNHNGRQPRRNRQPHDVGRIRLAHQHEPAQQSRHHVIGMRRACGQTLAFERAGDERLDRRARADECVDGHDCGHGARRAAPESARQRQAFPDRERDRTPLVQPVEERLRRDAGGVARRLPRQPTIVSADADDRDRRRAARDERGGHLVAGRFEREAENVETARDIRDGRGSKGGYCFGQRPDRVFAAVNERKRCAARGN